MHALARHVGPLSEMSSPCTRMHVCKSLWGTWHGEAAPREEASVLQNMCMMFSLRTWSFLVFHTRLAPLPLGPRPVIGHTRRALRPRESGLGSHQQLRSRRGLTHEKGLPDTPRRAELTGASKGGVAEKIGSAPLWRTSVHTKRERQRGASTLPLLVSMQLKPTELRPVRARASASVAYSCTSLSLKYFISC